ncbi:FAD-dependent monooxygenase [Paracoccaceae bacterium GXU_MW_L88]
MGMDSTLLIVGGGLSGPAMALAAAAGRLTSHVIDAAPAATRADRDFDGRAYAISAGSQKMLAALGLWDALEPHAQPILDIKVSDGKPGGGVAPLTLHFDHNELDGGPMGWLVEGRHIRAVLRAACEAEARITLMDETRVTAQRTTPVAEVDLSSGETLRGQLIIGADGRMSGTATRAGITRRGHEYGQTGLVCALAHEKPHQGVAHQMFLPEGPLAILPLTENRSSIVWSCRADHAEAVNGLDDANYLAHLRPRFGDFLGEITLAGKRFSYPLSLSIARDFTAPRLALIADAAHGVHPLAGQGLNLGFRDIAALAEVLTDAARRGEDIGAATALDRYASWRRADTAQLVLATESINRLFSNDNALLRAARVVGLGAVNAIPPLRRGFMREAAGLTGDLPRLMTGAPL